MKKLILTILVVMLVGLTINGQDYNDQYYDSEYGDQEVYYNDYEYDSSVANQEYYYDYENILPVIGRYSNVYYWEHPYKYINFVIIGERVYVIPRDVFYRAYRRDIFFAVSMERFIYLSCFGMSYYDNYYRFSLYNDYYRYNYYRGRSYGSSWLRGLKNHYRKSYFNRKYSRKYTALRNRYISKRGLKQNYRSSYGTSKNKITFQNRNYSSRGVNGTTKYTKEKVTAATIPEKAEEQQK